MPKYCGVLFFAWFAFLSDNQYQDIKGHTITLENVNASEDTTSNKDIYVSGTPCFNTWYKKQLQIFAAYGACLGASLIVGSIPVVASIALAGGALSWINGKEYESCMERKY